MEKETEILVCPGCNREVTKEGGQAVKHIRAHWGAGLDEMAKIPEGPVRRAVKNFIARAGLGGNQ